MRPPNKLTRICPRFSFQLCGWLSAVGASFSSPLESAEPVIEKVFAYAYLAEAQIPSLKVFSYERSQRDPFVDASVQLTLLSQKTEVEPVPEEVGLGQLFEGLSSELLRTCKINGVVCGEGDGLVLIGRHILRTGDKLDLPLGEELLKQMQTLDRTLHLRLGDIISLGVLSLDIEWIAPTGIGLSHALFEKPLTLPFQKTTPIP